MTLLVTTSDRFEGGTRLDDEAARAVHEDQPALHDAAFWDRSAAQMRAIVAFYEAHEKWSRATYYRPFIARFEQAAARERGALS